MLHFEVVERELRLLMQDRLNHQWVSPEEVAQLAKVREAMMLLGMAKLGLARLDAGYSRYEVL